MRALSSLTAVLFLLIAAPAGAALSTTHSGWEWGSPEPQGNSLNAIDLQGTTGYAAGDFGTLLRTNDGGSGWGTIRTGSTINFQIVEMIDADSVVVGSGCSARRTDDGGDSFRRLPFTSNEKSCTRGLRAVSFASADVGYLLLGDGAVLRTADGGRSFSPKSVPAAGGLFSDLMFRNANEGLATTLGGDIYRTTNGGNSWTREFDGDRQLNGVQFTGSEAVAVGNGGMFLTSPDAGDSWTRPAADPGAPTPPSDEFFDVRCTSPAVCLVVAGSTELFRTADGGRSFTDAGTDAYAVDYASATRAVAVGFAGKTQVSDNGGASFTQVGRRAANTSLDRVRATSASVAYAAGSDAALVRTTDGGETWEDIGVPTGQGVRDIWFPTASAGYALDFAGGLFRTTNGGGSWSILETGADGAPNGVFASDADHVFLIGPRGVLRSSDGGDSFERHKHRVIRNRTLVGADDAGTGVVFYGPRVIAVSNDDGDSWRHVDRPTRSEVRHVDFVSPRVGYVLEQSGRIYFTRNRGKSWKQLISVGYADGVMLAFGDRRHGWLELNGRHPNVLYTSDGGKSWTPQILGPTHLNGIAAAGSDTGFATDFRGILFTDDGGGAGAATSLRLRTSDRTVPRGTKIKIKGRLSPADGGEDVEVRVRRLTGRTWREIDVTPNRNGKFSFQRRIRRPMVFVSQWEGDPDSDGDGSRPLVVNVGG